jgi:L-aspartate oxidase
VPGLGIDISDFIPVVPAAHYICGIVTDLNGNSSLGNLYALGESAMAGVMGKPPASNSLPDLVFADRPASIAKNIL